MQKKGDKMKKVLMAMICIVLLHLNGEELLINNFGENQLTISSSNNEGTTLRYEINKLSSIPQEIEGEEYYFLRLEGESVVTRKGEPGLPLVRRALLIDNSSMMKVRILNSSFREFNLTIAPSKGPIAIGEDYDAIPFTFGSVYSEDNFYPGELAQLSDPYIIRDFRGINLHINPVQYNPVSGKIRVFSSLELEVYADGEDTVNIKASEPARIVRDFREMYKHHFVNYTEYMRDERYPEVEDIPGTILVVCYDGYMEAMEPYVEWKKQKGIATEIVPISDIGTTSTQLFNYIQSIFEEDEGLAWVLFVGDADHIPVIYNYGSYAGDPYYAAVAGTDYYADIMVGRFSAQSEADVETQVERTVYYERDIIEGDWIEKAIGAAYNGGPGGQHNEGGWEHMNYIRDDLLEYGYSQVDQIYEGQGGTTQMLANALNEGRGVMNYLGHGEDLNYFSIPFYISDVNNLENEGMLPFISNCACLIGNFAPMTCFSEAWLRATNDDGEPIGAIAFLGSSISQWIGDPEYGQDEFVDLLCAEEKQSIGGLWYNCINYAMEVTSEFDEFSSWNMFGDPSLIVRSKIPTEVELSHMPAIFMGLPVFEINAGEPDILVCLSREGEIVAAGITDDEGYLELDLSEAQQIPGELQLTATGFNKITLIENIQMIPPEGAYLYIDEYILQSGDDNIIHAGETAFLDLSLTNYGTELASDVYLEMTIDDPWIEVLDNNEDIGDMLPQENISLDDILCFQVSEDIEFAHAFFAELVFTSGEESWNFEIWFSSYAPDGLWMSPGEINFELTEGDSAFVNLIISNYMEDAVEINLRVEAENIRNIENSAVSCNTEEFLVGTQVNWDFTAHNMSADSEWICEIELDFPESVDINSASSFMGASGGAMETESELGTGVDIIWTGISPNGWGYLHCGESASSEIEAEIDYADLDSLVVEWRLLGDGYGDEPHEVSGILNLFNPLSWIYLDDIHDMVPASSFSLIEIELDAGRLPPGEYQCEIVVSDDRLETRIPVLLSIIPHTYEDEDVVTGIDRLSVYPNPFNPTLNISYNLSESGMVELAVYNLKGQKIKTLIESFQENGDHKLCWEASNMPSGIYFLKIKSASFNEIEKVILLK